MVTERALNTGTAKSWRQIANDVNWPETLPFVAFHVAALGVFFVPFKWTYVALGAAFYVLRMFGITAGYHRYFSHRSYKLGRVAQFGMALIGVIALQKGPLWWAAHHRTHHKHSDQAGDWHSPVRDGFIWSHVGWLFTKKADETEWDQIADFAKFPELRWLNTHFVWPGALLGALIFAFGGPGAFFWGFVVSTVLLWHGTFTINSLSHVFGSRRYATTDDSRNNFFLAMITLGEGWHNNHHCYQSSTCQGFYWWEIDFSYYGLKALSWLGIARDLRRPPLTLLEAKRIDHLAHPARPARAAGDAAYLSTTSR